MVSWGITSWTWTWTWSHIASKDVLHWKDPKANHTNILSLKKSEDLVSVPNGSQVTSGKHMEGCAALLRNATPRHYWPTAKPVMREDVGRQEDLLGVPTHHVHHKCVPAFICEEHSAPVVNLLILLFSAKCQTACVVLKRHNTFVVCWRSF